VPSQHRRRSGAPPPAPEAGNLRAAQARTVR
jgi:hypothetical protein